MDCYCLSGLMAVRGRAWRAGGDLVLAGAQPVVLRLLMLGDMVSRPLVFASVDDAVSGVGSAPAAPVMSGAADGAAAWQARSGIMSSAMSRGGAAVRHARRLPGLITTASRRRHDEAGTH
jgi:hypothetical protein